MDGTQATIFSDIACQLGEGPTYDPATNTVWWFDIVGRKLLEMPFPDGDVKIHDLPQMASALVVVDADRHVLSTETGLYVRDVKTGALSLLVPIEADDAATRSNDARVHPCGAFWIGTMGKNAEKHAGAIYWYFRGELRKLVSDISITNSICFSPDGKIAYFADTAKGILFRTDCDPVTGLPVGEPAIFLDHRGREGGIDGSVVDANGNLWNARWGAGRIDGYRPDGAALRSYDLPARQTSCPAFVGPDADRMAVTSAREGLDEAMRRADPQAGMTFLLDAKFEGRFEPKLAL